MKRYYSIDGMRCVVCAGSVEKRIGELDGVDAVSVNLMEKMMSCDCDPSMDGEIINAIGELGFVAKSIEDMDFLCAEDDREEESINRILISVICLVVLMYIGMGNMIGLPLVKLLDSTVNPMNNGVVQLFLTLPILWVNRTYYTSGFSALFGRRPNMDSLVSLGSAAAFIYGFVGLVSMMYGEAVGDIGLVAEGFKNIYFESAGMILTLITVGKRLEARAGRKTNLELKKLMKLTPDQVTVVKDGEYRRVMAREVQVGDMILVRPGDRISVDGVVLEGEAVLDQSHITGESLPVEVKAGGEVISGSINRGEAIVMMANKVGSDTVMAKIVRTVMEASSSKAPIASLADRIAAIFVPAVILIGLIAMTIWLISGESLQFALSTFVAVLIISCPCALGLATPLAITISLGKCASNGVLVKSAEAMEGLHRLDMVAFDKTGTITVGRPVIDRVIAREDGRDVIRVAASLERYSNHPIATSILSEFQGEFFDVEEYENHLGGGVSGEIEGERFYCGSQRFISKWLGDEDELWAWADIDGEDDQAVVHLATDRGIVGSIYMSDEVKAESKDSVAKLRELKIEPLLLTGDGRVAGQKIGEKVGISRVYSQLMPDEKAEIIAGLRRAGKKVAMVGDGINDAPALATAELGIALGNGTDIAMESGDIVLLDGNIGRIGEVVDFGRKTFRIIKGNLFWAFIYNILCIPLAAGALYPTLGLTLSPMVGAACMSLSSLFVSLNSIRLLKYRFR